MEQITNRFEIFIPGSQILYLDYLQTDRETSSDRLIEFLTIYYYDRQTIRLTDRLTLQTVSSYCNLFLFSGDPGDLGGSWCLYFVVCSTKCLQLKGGNLYIAIQQTSCKLKLTAEQFD